MSEKSYQFNGEGSESFKMWACVIFMLLDKSPLPKLDSDNFLQEMQDQLSESMYGRILTTEELRFSFTRLTGIGSLEKLIVQLKKDEQPNEKDEITLGLWANKDVLVPLLKSNIETLENELREKRLMPNFADEGLPFSDLYGDLNKADKHNNAVDNGTE